ncbi:MAG TPA: xanthine dehydrogenase family protein molybdopterin-binding subunit [Phycisphaerae bacterium]|nr:xanthine dehydrogenase family protein molybdopterin-binding subunit [Phycisphaerae bacterium]
MVSLIGEAVSRVDGRAKVTGRAKYAAEFSAAGCLHAVGVGATVARGKIVKLDVAGARSAPGVVEVFTHENMPGVGQPPEPPRDRPTAGQPGQRFVPMQSDQIRYAGQVVAVVVGRTLEEARAAAMRVRVEYDKEEAVFWSGEMGEPTEGEKPAEPKQNLPQPDSNRGDLDAAMASAPVTFRRDYVIDQEAHNPMEMSAAMAVWQGSGAGAKVTVYTATQGVMGAQRVLSQALEIPAENIKVLCPYVGGGFGCKGSTWPHEYLTAVFARQVGKPVKWMLSREEMFTDVGHRPMLLQRIEVAADEGGRLLGLGHHTFNATATYGNWVESASRQTPMLYSCPSVRTSHRLAPIDIPMPCQMRAPGHAPGTWALEIAMDELAYAVKKDPLQIRMTNYAEKDEGEKKEFTSKNLRACYQQAAERFGWAKRNHEPGSMKDGRLLVGWGLATATYPANQSASSARVQVLMDGTAKVSIASQDLGTGTYTILGQIAGERLGLPVEKVRVEIGNSSLPESPTSGGSQTAATAGNAVWAAANAAREEVVKAAMGMMDSTVAPDASMFDLRDGHVVMARDGKAVRSVGEVVKRRGAAIEGSVERYGGRQREYSAHSFGCQMVEVKIDPETKEIRVTRVVSRFCAGTILNRKTAHSQIMGAIVMGLGAALFEAVHYDERRIAPVNRNLADYLVPVNPDVPAIDCDFVEEEDTRINPLGVKGIGELGITGVGAAVANAVFHATGKRVRRLPVRMEMLLSSAVGAAEVGFRGPAIVA